MRATFFQFVRYALVGISSNLLIYIAYLGITAIGVEPKLAMTLLYAIGVLQTFVFNRKWTFRYQEYRDNSLFRYAFVYALGYCINLIMLWLLVDRAGLPHQLVQGGMIIFLAFFLFFSQKIWVFPDKRSAG